MKLKKKKKIQEQIWKDDIKEQTGMDFANITRADKKKIKWKEIVGVSHLLRPIDLARLLGRL